MELTEVAEELYALPLEDFTKTRNERAKELKAEDKELSERVKRLEKPTTAAWVVNMLVRHQADLLSQVLELGESLRQAQENLEGDELRELTKQRRQLTAAVTSQARAMARDLGVRISGAVADQVEETLRAAMIDEGAAKAVRTGQLLDALSATGVGELDVSEAVAVPEAIGMTARPVEKTTRKPQLSVVGKRGGSASSGEAGEAQGSGPARSSGASGAAGTASEAGPDAASEEEAEAARERAREEERRRAHEEAERAVEEAEQAAAKAQRKLEKAGKRVSRLEARSLQLQGELDELRRRASDLEHQLESLDDDLSEAEEKRDRARDKDEAARAEVEEARAALDELADQSQ